MKGIRAPDHDFDMLLEVLCVYAFIAGLSKAQLVSIGKYSESLVLCCLLSVQEFCEAPVRESINDDFVDIVQVPGIFGPGTGVCEPITVSYGSSGYGSQLQTFVAPSPGAPAANTGSVCKPSVNDTYVYTLGPSGIPSYTLQPGALPLLCSLTKK